MINRRAWSAAAAAMLAMGTLGAALPARAAGETPDALIKRVSTDVLETIKKDPRCARAMSQGQCAGQ